MSAPSCGDVCEVVTDMLLNAGFKLNMDDDDHTDILDALGYARITDTRNEFKTGD